MSPRERPLPRLTSAWREARRRIWERRGPLALGLSRLVLAHLAALVLPASSKLLVDDVVLGGRQDLLAEATGRASSP